MGNKAKLIYSMLVSLDGYTEDEHGKFGWGAPEDEEVHAYINKLGASLGTYLYGRKMYDTMVFWETALEDPNLPKVAVDWARQWQAAEKVVFSRTITEPRSARTRIENDFDPEKIKEMKKTSQHDMSVDGPELAAQAIKAGLVDEFQMIVCPVIVGGGKRFFPDDVKLDLKLIDEKKFASGVVVVRYEVTR
jgi:dihydrofolate reductase